MLPDTWFSRDLPVLEAAMELLDDQPHPQIRDLIAKTGMDEDDVLRALKALEPTYINVAWYMGRAAGRLQRVTDQARMATGAWPSGETIANRLIEAIDDRVEHSTGEERSRWVKVRDAVAGAGRDLLVEVSASVIARQMGAGG